MQLSQIIALHQRPIYPSVSLLAGISEEQPELVVPTLRRQLREVDSRLALEFSPSEVQVLRATLDHVISTIDTDHHARSIAVYASPRESMWVALPVSVRDRVVIDETFATRDVVHALLRTRRYRVLALGARTQLFEGVGSVLSPVNGRGFPIEVSEPAAGDAPRRRERTERERRRLRAATRAVDDALDVHLRVDPRPLFVVGVQPRLAWFEHHSRHRRAISGTAGGAPQSAGAAWGLVRPLVDELFVQLAADAQQEVDEARSARRLATGISEAWQLAREGRGSLVVVEEGYEYPAILGEDRAVVSPAADAAAPDVVDDLVDETIETVLAMGGRAVIVPDGTLATHERICLTLRY
jgi:hypothetical protein